MFINQRFISINVRENRRDNQALGRQNKGQRKQDTTQKIKKTSNMDPPPKKTGYHVKSISFSKKMNKYFDITKPDNGIRINININIDNCKFEPSTGEMYSIQHYVMKCVHYLRQVGGLIRAQILSNTINQTIIDSNLLFYLLAILTPW